MLNQAKLVECVCPRPHLTQFYAHTSAQHRKSERIRGSSKKRFEEKCLRKYVFAEIKSAFMFVWLCAEYFCAVFFLSTFLTVSIGMRWLCWPIASWQIYKKNEEDGTVNGQIFNIFCRFQFRLEWRAKCFELLLQQLLLLLPRAEIETLNWISFDANIEIISNSYSLCHAIPIRFMTDFISSVLLSRSIMFFCAIYLAVKKMRIDQQRNKNRTTE